VSFVDGAPRRILRAEGGALALAAVVAYAHLGVGWWLFAVLALAPDLAMAGYLAGPRVGALAYNAVHATIGPIALGLVGALSGQQAALAVALVWLAHVGVDRMLGYGLKYPTAFADTHLGRIGRSRPR
jgi:hypothetical protein